MKLVEWEIELEIVEFTEQFVAKYLIVFEEIGKQY